MIFQVVEHALDVMVEAGFKDMRVIVVADAIIPARTQGDIDSPVELHVSKKLIRTAIAGSIGSYNAQAANIVAAIFFARE
ncbi:hypothetical protein E4U53_000400 [Claviceps sorghi]|nr:hypothetical protein E4U53_000400 [Claviceps sorghi]